MTNELIFKGQYVSIEFDGTSESGKTNIFTVFNSETQDALGRVKWYGPWRQYSFFPNENIVLEKKCMRDIATFCENITKKRVE